MLPRHAISDADWDRIKDPMPGRPGLHGGVAKDNRPFIDAALYVGRTGIPWADLPERFGKPNTVWRRFDRRAKAGRRDPIPDALRDPDLDLLILTAAQESDIAQAGALLADHEPEAVIADEGYDSRAPVEDVERRGAEAVIPAQRTRKEQRAVDRHLYRERNLCERFRSKIKQYRRVATRYEKEAANYLAFVKVAAMMVMLR